MWSRNRLQENVGASEAITSESRMHILRTEVFDRTLLEVERAFDDGALGCRSHEVQRKTVDANAKLLNHG